PRLMAQNVPHRPERTQRMRLRIDQFRFLRDGEGLKCCTLTSTSSAMPVTTAEGTEVATVVVPVSALAPEVDLEWKQLHRHADGTLSWRPSGPPPGWRRSRT